MLFAGREVRIGNCTRGRRPRAVLKTEGTVFPNTDRPRPANNVSIFSYFNLFGKGTEKKMCRKIFVCIRADLISMLSLTRSTSKSEECCLPFYSV